MVVNQLGFRGAALARHALAKVFGGEQMRPNIHIEDMAELYIRTLEWPSEAIDGKVYNAGYHTHKVREIAEIVAERNPPITP